MKNYHTLLQRQLRHLLGKTPLPVEWSEILDKVNEAYQQFDRDRSLIERSMEISSQELLQANADIRAVLEGLIDYYLRIDDAGKVLYGRGIKIPEFLIGNKVASGIHIEEAIIPEVKTRLMAAIRRMNTDRSLHILDCEVGKDEHYRVYEVRCVSAHHNQISIIIRDVTTAHNAAVREQSLQLRLAKAERIESLGLLAGKVAHDLNNILSPLVSYPDILIEHFPPDHVNRKMIEQMQRSAIKAAAIIQDLLTLTRRGNHQIQTVNINTVIQQYLDSPEFASLSEKYPMVNFSYHPTENLPSLSGSAHQLEQAIINLIVNAFESISGQGDVRLAISLQHKPPVRNTTESNMHDSHILLEVIDTGIGIPENEIEHIYEPFFSRKKAGGSGTGLGLAIVYGTVKDYGGEIFVSSKPGLGTHFQVRLPFSTATTAMPVSSTQPTHHTDRPCRVLVIDDDSVQQNLCRHLLTAKGFSVASASSGQKGVEYLRQHDADIVLLDMIMDEDFDGLRTYETIRTFKPGQNCIIVSGYAKTDNVQKALSLGVRSFVQKPYTLKTILSAIQSALQRDTSSAA